MHLASPYSAIISAVIFNALIIPLLIPLALKGTKYRPMPAERLLIAQPADLWGRRDHRPVHRHQGHRYGGRSLYLKHGEHRYERSENRPCSCSFC